MTDPDRVVVRVDLFPARVSVVGTTYDNLRAVVTDTDLVTYRLGANSNAEEFQRWPLTGPLTGSEVLGYSIPTPAGEVYVVRSGSCSGCGSQLGSIDLYPGRQRVMIGVR